VSQAQYYAQQTLTNVSPALAEVSGDWMGPNAGGSTTTWHYVGSASGMSSTEFNANSLTITGAGSFLYRVDTTAEFVDPSSSAIFPPGAVGSYNGFFNTDVPTTYIMMALLSQWGRVRLNSLDGSVVFDQTNVTTVPLAVNLSGSLPAGQYRVLITAGLATQLPNGVNHYIASGGYEDVTFTVQIPEPRAHVGFVSIMGFTSRRRKRCARAA
jgi:hypothetical protein